MKKYKIEIEVIIDSSIEDEEMQKALSTFVTLFPQFPSGRFAHKDKIDGIEINWKSESGECYRPTLLYTDDNLDSQLFYKNLLKKYIDYIIQLKGTDYIPLTIEESDTIPQMNNFKYKEVKELQKLLKEDQAHPIMSDS